MSLFRNYKNIQVLGRIDANSFVGTIEWHNPHSTTVTKHACYGWTKGGSFFIYRIKNGHIEKLGTVKSFELEEK